MKEDGKKRVILSPILEDILEPVGENIKLARLRRKITATMLAEQTGISRVTLRKVENGESSVTMAIYANILFFSVLTRIYYDLPVMILWGDAYKMLN